MDLEQAKQPYLGKKIGVLMGGLSSERNISLRSGENIYNALVNLGLSTVKIDVDRTVYEKLKNEKIDIAFNVLHGQYGEDGAIQGLLDFMGIPYTGSSVLGSAVGMSKRITKKILSASGIPVPAMIPISADINKTLSDVEKQIGFPVVLKPNSEGSSFGVSLVHDKETLMNVMPDFIKKYPVSFIEQYIKGREITVGLLKRHGQTHVFPILELRPKKEFYDFDAKYTEGMTEFIIPAEIPHDKVEVILEYARRAYEELACSGVIRMDAMLDSQYKPYFLEANTIPGMTNTSDIPAMARAEGISTEELVLMILDSIEGL